MLGHLSPQLLQGEALWLITFGLLGVGFFAFVQLGLLLGGFLRQLCGLGHSFPPLLRHLLRLCSLLLLQPGVQLALLMPLPVVQLGLCLQMVLPNFLDVNMGTMLVFILIDVRLKLHHP